MKRRSRHAACAAAWLCLAGAAQSQPEAPCGGTDNPVPQLQPRMPIAPLAFTGSDASVDCFMWQAFIYLNWPALSGQRGQPDPKASFGAAGTVVWETYKSYDEVYLPDGRPPGPWNDASLALQHLRAAGVRRPSLSVRRLANTSEVFRAVNAGETPRLDEIHQVGGGVAYDQAGQPVYYEMLMDQADFDYVVAHQLYEAQAQYAYAKSTGIVLPPGSLEVKSAWKVLSPQELAARPPRFHTAQAVLPDGHAATVGLVALHVFHMPANTLNQTPFNQGFWATFQQVDNAPTTAGPTQQAYSFNNPLCAAAQCPPNARTTGAPTQVVQQAAIPAAAVAVNDYVRALVQKASPTSPWQFYALVGTQWPTSPQPFGKPSFSNSTPVANGSPNVGSLVNPLLETFLQDPGNSCLGCHTYASTKLSDPSALQSSLSFLFGHADGASAPR